MANETIADLRRELFAALRGLSDKENPMDIERARAISDVAQVIINSAKVEVELVKATGGEGSGFIPDASAGQLPNITVRPTLTGGGIKSIEHLPGATVTTHRAR